ncbi:MAG: hypothetical protein GC187_13310 [Alphaproteobacteria bacterium]|nr:hypothetical protein [Alphaproteobacteria bacterium]
MRECECSKGCQHPWLKAANDNESGKPFVVLPDDETLLRQSSLQRLAMAIGGLGKSRRDIPNWMADAIYGFDGDIRTADGRSVCLCGVDIDAAFNDDGSFRWLSDFLKFASRPPRQAAQRRVLVRLRLLLLALLIDRPEIAQHVAC